RDQKSKHLFEQRNSHLAVRPFLDKLFQPSKNWLVPQDDSTLVCRCEEVTVRQIRDAVKKGALSPDRVKSLIRCGMGPCQGRVCGLNVTEIIADESGLPPETLGYFKIRPPLRPITLGLLAQLH
ncbi:MAG TPA: (2Fe-2S)-binding protein, partial [Deltaproteobacteria bacterium]|nr:(2Fe-2S)-binding protein [Deltaproteobacteria bacterium]